MSDFRADNIVVRSLYSSSESQPLPTKPSSKPASYPFLFFPLYRRIGTTIAKSSIFFLLLIEKVTTQSSLCLISSPLIKFRQFLFLSFTHPECAVLKGSGGEYVAAAPVDTMTLDAPSDTTKVGTPIQPQATTEDSTQQETTQQQEATETELQTNAE